MVPEPERPQRSLPFVLQVLMGIALVVLLSITAVVFLSAQGNQTEVINDLLQQIHEDGERRDNRVVCLITVVIEVLPEDRTDEMIEACEDDPSTTPAQ